MAARLHVIGGKAAAVDQLPAVQVEHRIDEGIIDPLQQGAGDKAAGIVDQHIDMPEVRGAMAAGRLAADGRVLLANGSAVVTKTSSVPTTL